MHIKIVLNYDFSLCSDEPACCPWRLERDCESCCLSSANKGINWIFKFSEHKVRFEEMFSESNFLSEHNFLEHNPQIICEFGPLVALWTMHFKAKHSLKNVLMSLAERPQFLVAHHVYICINMPNSPLEVLKENFFNMQLGCSRSQ